MGIDFPAAPTFKPTMDGKGTITSNFYLININDVWLQKNFEFIQAFFAGTEWLHLKYCMVRPTNVYNVVCPGRFMLMWAAVDMTVEACGKLRKRKISPNLNSVGIKSIDQDTLWPDAWKMTVTIKDLTPNNFNMYANYYMNGFNGDEIKELENERSAVEMVTDLGKYIVDITKDVIDVAKAGYDSISNTIDDAVNKINEFTGKTTDKMSKK